MITLKNVSSGYDDCEVLHNIDLQFEPGKITVLIGPNGCGKSTLLKALVRINPHTNGSIVVNDIDAKLLVLLHFLSLAYSVPFSVIITFSLYSNQFLLSKLYSFTVASYCG